MSRDSTAPNRKVRIVVGLAIVLGVAGALAFFAAEDSDTGDTPVVGEARAVVATGCTEFEADARKLFDKNGATILSGNFAPGDHVHLAIDLKGAGLSWEAAGALGSSPRFIPSFWYSLFRTTKWTSSTTTTYSRENTLLSAVSRGKVNGFARWDLDIDIATAGHGALTISQTGNASAPPKVAIANCTSGKAQAFQRTDTHSNS